MVLRMDAWEFWPAPTTSQARCYQRPHFTQGFSYSHCTFQLSFTLLLIFHFAAEVVKADDFSSFQQAPGHWAVPELQPVQAGTRAALCHGSHKLHTHVTLSELLVWDTSEHAHTHYCSSATLLLIPPVPVVPGTLQYLHACLPSPTSATAGAQSKGMCSSLFSP